MTARARGLAATLVSAAALAAALTAPVLASAATYEASGGIATTVRWTFESAGYPRECQAWRRSTGSVRVRVAARGPFTLSHIPGGQSSVGGMQTEGRGSLNVERKVDYRIHDVGVVRPCYPCGPDSEFGDCGEEIPDVVGRRDCAPAATPATIEALLRRGVLYVSALARSAEILARCTTLVPQGVPVGPPEPKLRAVLFAGAARRIAGLARGESTRFRLEDESGAGCRPRSRARNRTCTTHLTEVTVRRVR